MTEAELLAAWQEEFAALLERQGETVELVIRLPDAWILMGQLQLAFRHPLNTGPSRQVAERICRRLEDLIAPEEGSALRTLAEMGWNPRFDEPRDPPPRRTTDR